MIRRLLKLAVAGFCLLSLVACVGVGWLWWRSWAGPYVPLSAEVACFHTHVEFTGEPGLGAEVICDWPGPPAVRCCRTWQQDRPFFKADPTSGGYSRPAWEYRSFGAVAESGPLAVYLEPDGSPARRTDVEWVRLIILENNAEPRGLRLSPTMTYWSVAGVPHWWGVTASGFPPLLWLAAGGRRRWVLRRRRRLGLCSRCGYDLRGSPPGGRCSECGAAAAAAESPFPAAPPAATDSA